jgi:uncharacterized phage-associated protein
MGVDTVGESKRGATIPRKTQLKRWFSQFSAIMSGMILVNGQRTYRFVRQMCSAAKEGAMHDSRTIADRFLDYASKDGRGLTQMQLQKLVYIAHGWKLGLVGAPLIHDEVQAWQWGPVIPRLYNAIRSYKDQPVQGPLCAGGNDVLDANEESLVRQIYDIYGGYSGPQLSRLTHAAGTPWALTYVPKSFGLGISNDKIQDHYRRLAGERAAK